MSALSSDEYQDIVTATIYQGSPGESELGLTLSAPVAVGEKVAAQGRTFKNGQMIRPYLAREYGLQVDTGFTADPNAENQGFGWASGQQNDVIRGLLNALPVCLLFWGGIFWGIHVVLARLW